METRIVRINPFVQPEMVEAIASVYQQSFGGEPWNEGYLCPVCAKTFALTFNGKTCPMCAERSRTVLLVEHWPKSKIVSDFYREMQKRDPVCFAALADGKVVGFTWGYSVNVDPDLDTHLDAPNLHQLIEGDFFYLDECAVTPSHQRKGWGKWLVSCIIQESRWERFLLRTMNDSPMCNLIKHKGGRIVQHISRNRVIMRLLTAKSTRAQEP